VAIFHTVPKKLQFHSPERRSLLSNLISKPQEIPNVSEGEGWVGGGGEKRFAALFAAKSLFFKTAGPQSFRDSRRLRNGALCHAFTFRPRLAAFILMDKLAKQMRAVRCCSLLGKPCSTSGIMSARVRFRAPVNGAEAVACQSACTHRAIKP